MKQFFSLLLVFASVQLSAFSQQTTYVPKVVKIKREFVKVNGTLNSTFGGNSRVLIEVPLPRGTVEWYFSFKTTRDKQSEEAIANTIGFTTKVAAVLASSYTGGASVRFAGLAESSIKSIAISKGEVPVNVYAFDLYNSQIFLKGDGSHVLNGSYNVSQSEGNSIVKFFKTGNAYIGVDNPNFRTGVWVDVEVTATILEKKEIYNQDNDFVINSGTTIMSSVKIFDIRGRLIQEKRNINANQATINGGLANGILLVQITSEDGTVVTKKVIK